MRGACRQGGWTHHGESRAPDRNRTCMLAAGKKLAEPGRAGAAQVQADVRTIRSRNFASRHSLRFPRVQRVRWDKAPTDIQTDAELWHIVESNKGSIVGARCAGSALPGLP